MLGATTLPPIGLRRTVIRLLTHLVDVVPVGVGSMWPLWDRRRGQRNALTPVNASPITNWWTSEVPS